MKAYSVDLRTKIVAACQDLKLSIGKTAAIFSVSKRSFQQLSNNKKLREIYSRNPGANRDTVI